MQYAIQNDITCYNDNMNLTSRHTDDNKSSAVAKMAAQYCTIRIVKRWGWVIFGKNSWLNSNVKKKLNCRKETLRLQRGSVLAKYNWKTIFFKHYTISNHCHVGRKLRKAIDFGKITQNKDNHAVQDHLRSPIDTNRKPVCAFLLLIYILQESQLSQRDRAAACLNFGKNISAKSVHLTVLYVMALTSTNHHYTVLRHHVCT